MTRRQVLQTLSRFRTTFVICGNQLAFLRPGLQGKICCPCNSTMGRAKESTSALHRSWSEITADFNLFRGRLFPLGLVFLLFAPLLAARLRDRVRTPVRHAARPQTCDRHKLW